MRWHLFYCCSDLKPGFHSLPECQNKPSSFVYCWHEIFFHTDCHQKRCQLLPLIILKATGGDAGVFLEMISTADASVQICSFISILCFNFLQKPIQFKLIYARGCDATNPLPQLKRENKKYDPINQFPVILLQATSKADQ